MDICCFQKRYGRIVLIGLVLLLFGCVNRAYLIVDYHIPEASTQFSGMQLRVDVNDTRTDRYILAPAAARQFKGFQDIYSLAWVAPDKKRTIVGEYDLKGLFKIAFKKRLESMGVAVQPDDDIHALLLQIDLHELKIDQEDHNWVARMSYTASLVKDDRLVARENVKGRAERVKIIGRKGADDTLSDIFSDIINRLNFDNLFEQAHLK